MDWNVKNARNVDVERQHLNKILAEIRASVDDAYKRITTIGSGQQDVQAIVGKMVTGSRQEGIAVTYSPTKQQLEFIVKNFTISLTGAVQGSGTVNALGNVTIETTGAEAGITDAPQDGYAYWRRMGNWQRVPSSFDAEEDTVISFSFGDASPRQVWEVERRALVTMVRVKMDTAFNGTTPTLTVGTAGSPALLFPSAYADLKTVSGYEYTPDEILPEATVIYLTLAPSGSSVGSGKIIITTIPTEI